VKASRNIPILAAVVATCLPGCDDRSAGNSLETENAVAARVIAVDSVLPYWNRPFDQATVAVLRLDGSNFPFDSALGDGRDVVAETEAKRRIPFRIVTWDSAKALARLEVRIEGALLAKGSKFLLRWDGDTTPRSDSQSVWRAVPDSQALALNSTLISDFENGGTRSLLPIGTSWYSVAPESTTISSPKVVQDTIGWAGKVMQVSFSADTTKYRYVVLGLDLKKPRSFRTLDSIVFRARGTGTITVALDRLGSAGANSKAWVHFPLRQPWRRFVVKPSTFLARSPVGDNIGFEAIKDSVTNLTFLLGGGPDLQIDDIRIHGLNRDDFR
jgi:hypothetical protein